jgi:hypothetical protein
MRPMSYLLLCLALVLSLIVVPPSPATAASPGYVEGFEDLPLAPGLANMPDAGTNFDKPAGRIVVAYATGSPAKTAIEAFYRRTLPQLGWKELKPGQYVREGERLVIEVMARGRTVTVRYTLSPQ